jgi:DNA-binding transcriptional MerR regulator
MVVPSFERKPKLMGRSKEQEISLAELAEQSGVPGRTIRFYIARGLLSGPSQAGRGASYGQEHLGQLREIKNLQAKGFTLAEIARSLGQGRIKSSLPEPSAWWNYSATSDVQVWVRADLSPWRLRQVQKALNQLVNELKSDNNEEAS